MTPRSNASTLTIAGPISIDHGPREAMVYNTPLILSSGEFDMLRLLAGEPCREWSRAELADRLGERHLGWVVARTARLRDAIQRAGLADCPHYTTPERIQLFEPWRLRAFFTGELGTA